MKCFLKYRGCKAFTSPCLLHPRMGTLLLLCILGCVRPVVGNDLDTEKMPFKRMQRAIVKARTEYDETLQRANEASRGSAKLRSMAGRIQKNISMMEQTLKDVGETADMMKSIQQAQLEYMGLKRDSDKATRDASELRQTSVDRKNEWMRIERELAVKMRQREMNKESVKAGKGRKAGKEDEDQVSEEDFDAQVHERKSRVQKMREEWEADRAQDKDGHKKTEKKMNRVFEKMASAFKLRPDQIRRMNSVVGRKQDNDRKSFENLMKGGPAAVARVVKEKFRRARSEL